MLFVLSWKSKNLNLRLVCYIVLWNQNFPNFVGIVLTCYWNYKPLTTFVYQNQEHGHGTSSIRSMDTVNHNPGWKRIKINTCMIWFKSIVRSAIWVQFGGRGVDFYFVYLLACVRKHNCWYSFLYINQKYCFIRI